MVPDFCANAFASKSDVEKTNAMRVKSFKMAPVDWGYSSYQKIDLHAAGLCAG